MIKIEQMDKSNTYEVTDGIQYILLTKQESISLAKKIIKKLGSKEWCEVCGADKK